MRIRDIQEYMKEDGYDIGHSSILQGINSMAEKVSNDRDYSVIIKQIEQCTI